MFWSWFTQRVSHPTRPAQQGRRRKASLVSTFRPRLEGLEDRTVLSLFSHFGTMLGDFSHSGGGGSSVATHLAVHTSQAVEAGSPASVEVVSLNAANHRVRNYTGTVHLTSSDTAATLPANFTFTASDHGHHTFQVTLATAGSDTITATDTANSSITGSTTTTVDPASAITHFQIKAPSTVEAGEPFFVRVLALDVSNNPVGNFSGTVHFTSTDSAAKLPADATLLTSTGTGDRHDHFPGGFQVTLSTTGSQTITVTDTSNRSLTGSVTLTVVSATDTPMPGDPDGDVGRR